ncbi:MAG: flagellar biosynthesis protein FliQ [Dehalobacterium sp.]
MDQVALLRLIREALMLVLLLAAPALLVALFIGVAISVVQAATQIQEQTLTFVPKIVAIIITLLITASWMLDMMVVFTTDIFTQMTNFVR